MILGVSTRERTTESGSFDCPYCHTPEPYRRVTTDRWFTVLYLPIIPVGREEDQIECQACFSRVAASVLGQTSPPTGSSAFDDGDFGADANPFTFTEPGAGPAANVEPVSYAQPGGDESIPYAESVDDEPIGYADHGGYATSPPVRSTAPMAITSLTLAVLSPFLIFFCGLSLVSSLVAIVTGHVAIYQIGRSGGLLEGRGLAIGGLVTGYLCMVLSVGVISMIAYPAFMQAIAEAETRQARSRRMSQVPKPATPNFRTPELKTPEFKTPEFKTPELKTSPFRSPPIQTPTPFEPPSYQPPDFNRRPGNPLGPPARVGRVPDGRVPHYGTPIEEIPRSPDGGRPPSTMPGGASPGAGTRRPRTPEINIPDMRIPDMSMPEMRIPDTRMPDTRMPDTRMPDTRMPDTRMPDTRMPDTRMPDTRMPELKIPEIKIPDIKLGPRPGMRPPGFAPGRANPGRANPGRANPGRANPGRAPVAQPKNAQAAEAVQSFPDMGWAVKSLAFSPDDRWLAVGKQDAKLLLLDIESGNTLSSIDKLKELGQVTAVAFSPDSNSLLAAGYKGTVATWPINGSGDLGEMVGLLEHKRPIDTLALSPKYEIAMGASRDELSLLSYASDKLQVRNTTAAQRKTLAIHLGAIAMVTDGSKLDSVNLKTGQLSGTQKLGSGYPHAADFSGKGDRLAISRGSTIDVVDTKTGTVEHVLRGAAGVQWTVAFLPDGNRLISGGQGAVTLWDLSTGQMQTQLELKSGGYVQTIAISHDGKLLAAIGSSAGQTLWVVRIPE